MKKPQAIVLLRVIQNKKKSELIYIKLKTVFKKIITTILLQWTKKGTKKVP